jgi:2'-5' RNA ligase
MIAFYPHISIAEKLAIVSGDAPEDLHITLAYLGKSDEIPAMSDVERAMENFAKRSKPVEGLVNGLGRFNASDTSDSKDVIIALLDLPALPEFRHDLICTIEDMSDGAKASRIHGFTPHMTLSYVGTDEDAPVKRVDTTPVRFESIFLVVGEEKKEYKLEGGN